MLADQPSSHKNHTEKTLMTRTAQTALSALAISLVALSANADTIIASSRADAAKLQEELRGKARAEAEGIIKNAERQLQQQQLAER